MSQHPAAVREHGTLHVPDVSKQNDVQITNSSGSRSCLFSSPSPERRIIGTLSARHKEVRPFTPATDPAPRNLRRSGGHRHRECALAGGRRSEQTRSASVSRIPDRDQRRIGRHLTIPVRLAARLASVVETAVRLCRADHAMIYRRKEGEYQFAAGFGSMAKNIGDRTQTAHPAWTRHSGRPRRTCENVC